MPHHPQSQNSPRNAPEPTRSRHASRLRTNSSSAPESPENADATFPPRRRPKASPEATANPLYCPAKPLNIQWSRTKSPAPIRLPRQPRAPPSHFESSLHSRPQAPTTPRHVANSQQSLPPLPAQSLCPKPTPPSTHTSPHPNPTRPTHSPHSPPPPPTP